MNLRVVKPRASKEVCCHEGTTATRIRPTPSWYRSTCDHTAVNKLSVSSKRSTFALDCSAEADWRKRRKTIPRSVLCASGVKIDVWMKTALRVDAVSTMSHTFPNMIVSPGIFDAGAHSLIELGAGRPIFVSRASRYRLDYVHSTKGSGKLTCSRTVQSTASRAMALTAMTSNAGNE
ncbi:hypothetical protein U1Q18_044767 [Sarracenia purpurea var. burkii]